MKAVLGRQCSAGYATSADPSNPTVRTLEQFRALTTLSLNTPIVVYATTTGDESIDKELVTAVHSTNGAIRLARLDTEAPELAPLVPQLHIQSLPTTLLLFGGRLMDAYPGVPSGQALQEYIAQILQVADHAATQRVAQGQQEPSASEPPACATPEELLNRAYAALGDPEACVETDALPLLQEVLAEGSGSTDVERVKAYAGAARCTMLGRTPDLEGAKALVDAAMSLLPEDKRPPEAAAASAELGVVTKAQEAGALGADPDPKDTADLKDPEALYKLALALFCRRQRVAAMDAALRSVRFGRTWNDGAARKLLIDMFAASGAGDPAVHRARSRLTNLLFI